MITLIVPCFNEQDVLPVFYKETVAVLEKMNCPYELLFVDDGSSDDTLKERKSTRQNSSH